MKASAAATPVVLAALAAGAVAYAYLVDRGSVSDLDRAARARDVFPSFRVDEVTRVQIENGGEAFALERAADAGRADADAWVLTSPQRQRADSAAVDLLLRELELATRIREVREAHDVHDVGETGMTGLDAPRARGTVTVGRFEYRFALGADALRAEGGAYMNVGGEGTFVVGRSLKAQLLRGRDSYRDRTLVALGASDVARLDVARLRGARLDGQGFTLERAGATFRVAGLRASRTAVDHVFSVLADARAESFLDDGTGDRVAGSDIVLTLAPRAAGLPQVRLRVGAACPGRPDDVVVQRTSPSPVAACTAKGLVEALDAPAGSLIDLSPIYARADEIEQVRLEGLAGGAGSARVELARKGSGWHLRAPEDRDLTPDESESANELALALANARAIDARRAGAQEHFDGRARATVVRTGDETQEVIELGGTDAGGDVLARRADDGAILRLPRAVARRFEPHPAALRPRAIWSPAFDEGSVVAVDDGCAPVPEHLERRDRGWTMLAPRGFAADPLSVADLVGAVAHAKAEAWIGERNDGDDGAFGFGRPGSCKVTLTVERGLERRPPGAPRTRQVALVFGAREDGQVYARALDDATAGDATGGDQAVFVAPDLVRDLASRIDVDRGPLRLDPAKVTSVSLARDGARFVLERVGDNLVVRGRDGDDAGDHTRLESALSGFYPQAAVHTGPALRDEGMDHPVLEITERTAATDAGPRETRVIVGAAARLDGADVYFVRASGVDATFVVAAQAVDAIVDAW